MLSTLPTELQSQIVSFLRRRDLAVFARTSRHFHAVAIRTLYEHVELRSVAHVKAFFGISSLLLAGSTVAIKHAESKRAQWANIRSLEISFESRTRKEPVVTPPRSLRARGAARLRLDRLRLAYYNDITFLLPLLKCMDPLDVSIRRTNHNSWDLNSYDRWASATFWTDVARFTLVGHLTSTEIIPAGTSTSHPNAKQVTLVCGYWLSYPPYILERGVAQDLRALLRLCPNAVGIELRVSHEGEKERVEKVLKDGIAGKPASFFSVGERLGRSNAWGDAEEGDA